MLSNVVRTSSVLCSEDETDELCDDRKMQATSDHVLSSTSDFDNFAYRKAQARLLTRCCFRQMQTRSADEPMTTFVTCLECNNR